MFERSTRALALTSLLTSAACAPRERQIVSDGFRYVVRQDEVVAPETLATLGQHRRALENYLLLEPKAVGEIVYHKFRDRQDLHQRGHCSEASSACFYRQWGVETHAPFERHELIHAYVAHWGDSHRLLEEGLADALSCGQYLPQKVDISAQAAFSAEAWLSLEKADIQRLYAAGARFVAHLMRVYGVERFRAFYSRTLPAHAYAEIRATFVQVFGADLEGVWQGANDVAKVDAACLRAYECSWPEIENTSGPGKSPRGTLTVGANELLRFSNDKEQPFRLGPCDEHAVLPYESERLSSSGEVRGAEQWLALAPGKYWVELGASRVERRALSQYLVPTDRCSSARALDLSERRDVFFAVAAQELTDAGRNVGRTADERSPDAQGAQAQGGVNALALVVHTGSSASVPSSMECSNTARVELCTACDYMQCQVVCGSQRSAVRPASLLLGDRAVLKVTPDPASNLWFRLRLSKH